MSKHTPGPWIRKGENVWNDVEMMYHAAPNFDTISPSQVLIANAKLIAAAPKMLDTLKSVIEWTEDSHAMPDDMRGRLEFYARREILIRNAARAAIEGVES